MKTLSKIFQALLGVVALLLTSLIAFGRLAWRTIRNCWRKSSKIIRKAIAMVLICICVGFVILWAYCIYDKVYYGYYHSRVSNNLELHSFPNNKWRVYNNNTEKYTTKKIDWLSEASENDSIAVYAIKNRRGFINTKNGEIIIDAKANDYEKAWVFSEGLAAVVKDGKIGFINKSNELVIPFQFDCSDNCRMYYVGYLFHNGYCVMTNKEGDIGLIDIDGNWIVEPEYDEVWAAHKTGYRVVVKDGNLGALDQYGKLLYPAEYDYVDIVSDGFVLTQNGRMWQVDFEGNVVKPFMFGATNYIEYPVSYDSNNGIEYALSDYMEYYVMGRYGIMNRITGKPITPALYYDIHMISDKLFKVEDPESEEWHLLDVNGKMVN